MELRLITASTGPPLTLRDAQDQVRDYRDEHGTELLRKLNAATEYCQRDVWGKRQFMPATFEMDVENFPGNNGRITLPHPPAKGVTSVKYYDTDGVQQTLSSTAYDTVLPTHEPGFVEPAYGEVWPTTRARADAVTVRYVAGYASRADVPAGVKEAILMKTEQLYDPGRCSESDICRAVHDLMNHYEYGHYS
jgi:uncharacterized phiE125 gp8 family phage protein